MTRFLALFWIAVFVSACQQSTPTAQPPEPALKELQSSVDALHQEIRLLRSLIGEFDFRKAERELARLEEIVADRTAWPEDTENSQILLTDFQNLLASYPPLVQESLLPRLLPLRWNLQALLLRVTDSEAVMSPGDAEDRVVVIEDRLMEIENLMSVTPTGAAQMLVSELDRKRSQLDESLEHMRRILTVRRAKQILSSNGEHLDSIEAVWHELDALTAEADIDQLRRKLRERLLLSEVIARCDEFNVRLQRLHNHPDPVLRQAGVSALHEQVAALNLELFLDDEEHTAATGVQAALNDRLKPLLTDIRHEQSQLARKEEDRRQERRRRYQQWALQQIAKFNARSFANVREEIKTRFASFKNPDGPVEWPLLTELDEVRKSLAKKVEMTIPNPASGRVQLTVDQQKHINKVTAGTVSWHHLDDLASLASREAAVKYLLPIDQSLLESPVQQLYAKAFQDAWSTAQSFGGHQLHIAQKTVTIPKVGISDRRFDLEDSK